MTTSAEGYPVAIGLYDPVKRGGAYIADITPRVWPTWRRTIARLGGFLQGTSDYLGTDDELDDMFLYGMERQVIESVCGLVTWHGFVGAMSYVRNGVTLTRTLADATNAVKSIYTRLFDNLLTNGSAESGPWTVYGTATVTQDTTWFTAGTKSCKIVSAGGINGARISGAGYGLTLTPSQAYNISVDLNVLGGSWRISVNRADNDQSLAFFSTRSRTGQMTAQMSIPNTSTYAGAVDFRITSEASAGTIYADNAQFTMPPLKAETSWNKDQSSISEFGEMQKILLRAGMSDAAANAEVLTLRQGSAWVRTTPPEQMALGKRPQTQNKLSITWIGFAHTLDWKNTTVTGSSTIHDAIKSMVQQGEFVTAGSIMPNATVFTIEMRADQTLWKVISDAVAAGDTSGQLASCGVYKDRELVYAAVDTDTKYKIDDGILLNMLSSEVDPWYAVPAYCEVQDFPGGPGSITGDGNDDPRRVLLDQVEFVAPETLNVKRWVKPT